MDEYNAVGIRLDGDGPVGRFHERQYDEASILRKHGHQREADNCERIADEAVEALRDFLTEPLTVAEAAEWSGYSEDHLRELVRRGSLPDVARDEARQGAPILVPRHALPRKPLHERRSSAKEDASESCPRSSRSGHTRVGRALEDVAAGVDRE